MKEYKVERMRPCRGLWRIIGLRCVSGILRAGSSKKTVACEFDVFGHSHKWTFIFKDDWNQFRPASCHLYDPKSVGDMYMSVMSPCLNTLRPFTIWCSRVRSCVATAINSSTQWTYSNRNQVWNEKGTPSSTAPARPADYGVELIIFKCLDLYPVWHCP